MTHPRRHHLLPQSYLRRFADSRSQVRVVSRTDLRHKYVAGVTNVAVERDFYMVVTEDGPSQDIERLLSQFEGAAETAFDRILRGEFPPQKGRRTDIAVFVAFQWLRGRDVREAWNSMQEHLAKLHLVNPTPSQIRNFFRETEGRDPLDEEITDLIGYISDPDNYHVETDQNESIETMLRLAPALAEHLMDARIWQLLRTDDSSAFLTSDAPVTLWTQPERRHPFYWIGWATAQEIAFPLSRTHALVFAHDASFGEAERKIQAKSVSDLNHRTACNGQRWIIHHTGDDPLHDMILPPRPRITVNAPPARIVLNDT